jgi:Fe-S-cluster containining protein
MHCLRCGVCCSETEMLLATEDIERLLRKGYSKTFFAKLDSNGYFTLKNFDGFCVFYDKEKRRCNVRAIRPAGCRIYPVMYDEDKGIVIDDICPAADTINEKQKVKRGKRVLKLLKRIDTEAQERNSK